jgi:4-hydroxybenzoate polyprenyltransferase
LGEYYYFGLLLAAGLALYQQFLIRDREPEQCFKAFLNNNWFGAAVFSGIILEFLARS